MLFFRAENRVGGNVCEAPLEPSPVAPPHAAPLGFLMARGPKNAKPKIGERPVLFFKVENRVGGNVCEALLEPTHVALPPMLHL